MKETELRIGNWVINPSGEYVKVGYEIIRSLIVLDEKPNYQPIPLTPEILEKAGFEKVKNIYRNKRHRWAGGIFMEVGFFGSTENQYPYFQLGNYDSSLIKHLHQLQNICFALTGEELEISNVLQPQ